MPTRRASRIVIATTSTIVGVGAVFGGWGLLTDPAGMGADVDWLDGSPFPDFTIPGLVLLVVIGGGMLTTAVLAILGARTTHVAAAGMGIVLLGWGLVETAVLGYQGWQQLVLLGAFVLAPAAILIASGGIGVDRDRSL